MKLSTSQMYVLRFAADNGVIAAGYNMSREGSRHTLPAKTCASLEKLGLLRGRVGNDGPRWYEITEAGRQALKG